MIIILSQRYPEHSFIIRSMQTRLSSQFPTKSEKVYISLTPHLTL